MTTPVKKVLTHLFDDDIAWKVRLLDNWNSIIGPMGTTIILLHIRDSMVILGVLHPAWVQELHHLRSTIVDSINKFLGKEYIKNIQFQVVAKKKTPDTPLRGFQQVKSKKIEVEHRALTFNEEQSLEAIKDEGLRDALRHYLVYCPVKK